MTPTAGDIFYEGKSIARLNAQELLHLRQRTVSFVFQDSNLLPYMKVVIDTLVSQGVRENYIILVGGAPLNEEFSKAIGADAYCRDAAVAASLQNALLLGNFKNFLTQPIWYFVAGTNDIRTSFSRAQHLLFHDPATSIATNIDCRDSSFFGMFDNKPHRISIHFALFTLFQQLIDCWNPRLGLLGTKGNFISPDRARLTLVHGP